MRLAIPTVCLVIGTLALPAGSGAQQAQMALKTPAQGRTFSGSTFLAKGQIVESDLFVSRVAPDGMEIRGSVLFRNETREGYCAQVIVAAMDQRDSIINLGRATSACVNGGRGSDITRPVRVESILQAVGRPLERRDEYFRIVARAIPDTAVRLTPQQARVLFTTQQYTPPPSQQRPPR